MPKARPTTTRTSRSATTTSTPSICEVTPTPGHNKRAWERFTPDGPLALLPLGNEYSIVFTLPPAKADAVMAMDDEAFLAALQTQFGQRMTFSRPGPRSRFPLALRMRDTLVKGNEVWIGNTAQTLHPVSGQGFNLGLRDAWQLAEILLENGVDRNSLDSYAASSPPRPPGQRLLHRPDRPHLLQRFRPAQTGPRPRPARPRSLPAGPPFRRQTHDLGSPRLAVNPGRLQAWFLACRPKTLSVSLSPVLVGTAVAWHDSGRILWLPLLAAAFGAAFIQIGTNLFNDVGDFLRGTDTPDRLGPEARHGRGLARRRARSSAGAWLSFALAFLCGIYLVRHGGWPIVAIGLASLAAGWAYTGGPKPIAYGPLGEVFVFVFFGLVAVGGSYYLQTLTLTPVVLLAATLVGIHAAAVITVNNYRDRDGDARNGKNTLAVLLGRPATRKLYTAEMLAPYLLLPLLAPGLGWPAALPLFSLPLTIRLIQRFHREAPGPVFNNILAASAGLQLAFALLLALAFSR